MIGTLPKYHAHKFIVREIIKVAPRGISLGSSKNNSIFYNKIKRLCFSKWNGMGLLWTLKKSTLGLDRKNKKETIIYRL
jgi:hypothetical protein